MLSTELCPSERVAWAVNAYPPHGLCGSAARLGQAATLACAMSKSSALPWQQGPPEISSLTDIGVLEAWIFGQAVRARQHLSRLYLEYLPERVVEDIREGQVGSGTKDGEHGILVAELSPALLDVVNGWLAIERELSALGVAVRLARMQLDIVELEGKVEAARLAIEQLQLLSAMAHNLTDIIGSATSFSQGNMVAHFDAGIALVDTNLLAQQKALVDDIQGMQKQLTALNVGTVLVELSMSVEERFSNLQVAINQVSSATSRAMVLTQQIRAAERQARWAAAKATGADFVVVDGEPVAIPINAVYNRQYDQTKKRYEAALTDAKYLAYVARLAIEQRIGRRLETLDTALGPVEAPSLWADDICRLTGVDYESMREVDIRYFAEDLSLVAIGDAGTSETIVIDPAMLDILLRDVSPYVGDYVAKLENFIDYYNISYPFHEGDDTVVLSLRDDVLGPREGCTYPAPNLLTFSHALHEQTSSTKGSGVVGWLRSSCDQDASKCLDVVPGEVLASPDGTTPSTYAPVPPSGVSETGATWLRDVAPAEAPQFTGETSEVPGVSQLVKLEEVGSYVLSWWDQARKRDVVGEFPTEDDPEVPYAVEVRGPDGEIVASFAALPYRPMVDGEPAAGAWSGRRLLHFDAATLGDYIVTFRPSHIQEDLGSVVIANAQLEQVLSSSSEGGPYYGTSAVREVTGRCESLPPSEFRAAFERRCDASSDCYYELVEPLTIDTALLSSQNDYLGGAFARGNYNFRHITVALNIAGTGVVDCTANPQASCYGDGTLRYTLEHDAFQTDVIAGIWQGELEKQSFNFGSGAIRRGQALAAERFITMPVGSADAALLGQSGVTKKELMGRPLGGSYRLKVWDADELMWERVEDIQIVLKYRYWSAVDPGS